jgi:hypothetical protein
LAANLRHLGRAGELLIPSQAALKAAFAVKTNDEVAALYGVSAQFAQMRMKGARVHAGRALVKQARSRQPLVIAPRRAALRE